MGKTHLMRFDEAQYAAIFGKRDTAGGAGRTRLCKVCGEWHSLDKPWPHNCRPPAPPRADYAAPMLAPKFEPFKPSMLDDRIINDRREKLSYMDEHDLVEYDEGVKPEREPTDREWEEQFVADVKRAQDLYPGENVEPVDIVGQTDLDGSPEVEISDIEVADMGPKA